MREIDFEVSEEAEKEWKKDRTFTRGNLVLKEETGLLPVMQIGEVPSLFLPLLPLRVKQRLPVILL